MKLERTLSIFIITFLLLSSVLVISPSDNTAVQLGSVAGGSANENFGSTVSYAGDINGDGIDDVIIGAPGYDSDRGRAYIFFGGPWLTGDFQADDANVTLNGSSQNDKFGWSVSGSNDFNADGFDDYIIGAPGNSTRAGNAFIFFGGSKLSDEFKADDANITVFGEEPGSELGYSVSFAGDINNDGYNDTLVGSPGNSSDKGALYVIFGADINRKMINVSEINNTFYGLNTGERFATSVSGAGDFNNDGYDDVLVGASGAGRAYIYYGGDPMNTWLQTTKADFDSGTIVHINTSSTGGGTAELASFYNVKANMAYFEANALDTPRNRSWDQNIWGMQESAINIGTDENNIFVMKSGTVRKNEKVLAVSDEGLDINIQVSDGLEWRSIMELTDVMAGNTYQSFDITYESISGDALVVYYNKSNPGSPNTIPRYRIWNGTAWSAEGSAKPGGVNEIYWVKLAASPLSDEITMVTLDSDSDIYAQVWNGSEWGNLKLIETKASRADRPCFNAIYESQSGNAMIIWGGDSLDNKNINYRRWKGDWIEPNSSLAAADANINYIKLASEPKSNYIISANLDDSKDIDVQVWNGSGWSAPVVEVTGNAEDADRACFDVAWESHSNKQGLVVYGEGQAEPKYREINGTSISAVEKTVKDPNPDSNKPNWVVLERDPQTNDIMLMWMEDDGSGAVDDISAVLWNGSNWTSEQNIVGNSDRNKHHPFDMAYTDCSGYLTSAPYDAGTTTKWGRITWNALVPENTTLVVRTRTSDDGFSWSNWSEGYENGDTISSQPGRFIQYQVKLGTASITQTPELYEVRVITNSPDIIINGSTGKNFGWAVTGAGNVNDDSFDDIIISAPLNNTSTGAVYLFHGNSYSSGAFLNYLTDSNVTFNGENTGDVFGFDISSAGDFNNDGTPDILVGAPNANFNGTAYVFYGSTAMPASISAADADFSFTGENPGDLCGASVSCAGNIDTKLLYDIITGSPSFDAVSGEGKVYLITNDNNIRVDWVGTYNMSGFEKPDFIVGEMMKIRAKVTHALHSNNIVSAYITIRAPNGSALVNNLSMQLEQTDSENPSFWKIFNYTFTNPTDAGEFTVEIFTVDIFNFFDILDTKYTLDPDQPAEIIIEPSSKTLVANGTDTSNITLKIRDMYGNPIPSLGGSITLGFDAGSGSFGTIFDFGNGTYYFNYTSVTASEPDTVINVSIGAVSNTSGIELLHGPLDRIELTPSSVDVTAGSSREFLTVGFDKFNNVVSLVGTVWNTDIGSFSSTADANATFKAQNTDDFGYVRATVGTVIGIADVNIIPDELVRIAIIPDTADLVVNSTKTFNAVGYDIYDNHVDLVGTVWSIDIGTIITYTNSYATIRAPISVGTGNITATIGLISDSADFQVIPGFLEQIVLTPDNIDIIAGGSMDFSVIGYDGFGNEVSISPVWTSNVGTMIGSTLSAQTSIKSGYVRATVGSIVGYANVFIINDTLEKIIIIPDDIKVEVGSKYNFITLGYDKYNNEIAINPAWETNVGVMNGSLLTAQTVPGNGFVRASVSDLTSNAAVSVSPGTIHHIQVTPENIVVVVGRQVEFEAAGYDRFNNLLIISPIWYSSIGSLSGSVFTAQVIVANGTVTAAHQGIKGIANVSLVPEILNIILVTPPNVELFTGESQIFNAIGYDKYNNLVNLKPSWSSDAGIMDGNIFKAGNLPGIGSITASVIPDGTTEEVFGFAKVTVLIGEIPGQPKIINIIPDQVRREDAEPWALDLTLYESDDTDPDFDLRWYATGVNDSLYIISGEYSETDTLTFTPVKNSFGCNKIILWLEDRGGLVDHQSLWINITPVNDEPTVNGAPDLILHYNDAYTFDFVPYINDIETPKHNLVLETEDHSEGNFTFVNGLNVTFNYPERMLGQDVFISIIVSDGEASGRDIIKISITDDYVPNLLEKLPDITMYEGTVIKNAFNLNEYFIDPDEDSLFYSYGATHVEIVIHEDDHVDISSLSEWSGIEYITFRAEDPIGALAEDSIMINVLPINDPPVISGVPDLIVHHDYDYGFDLTRYIIDQDNETSELDIYTSDPDYIRFSSINNMAMIINYPESMMDLMVPVTITVTDGLLSNWQIINITVTDDYPPEVSIPLPDVDFDEDTEIKKVFDLDNYFFDLDGDSLFYSYGYTNIVVMINNDNTVDFTAILNWNGLEFVTFRAEDPAGAISEFTIKVTVIPINDVPVIHDIPPQKGEVGEMWVLDLRYYLEDVDNDINDLEITVDDDVAVVSGIKLVFHSDYELSKNVEVTVSDGNKNITRSFRVSVSAGETVIPISEIFYWGLILVVVIIIAILLITIKKYRGNFTVDEAFLVYQDGILIHHCSKNEKIEDDNSNDIISGMLTAIQDFVRDSFAKKSENSKGKAVKGNNNNGNKKEWQLQELQLEGHNILIEHGRAAYIAILYSGSRGWVLNRELKQTMMKVESIYADELKDWDGNLRKLKGIELLIETLFKDDNL